MYCLIKRYVIIDVIEGLAEIVNLFQHILSPISCIREAINCIFFITSAPCSSTDRPETHLYVEINATQWPIVYSRSYNIGFLGLEKLHPFDSGKWGRVFDFLQGQ